ncbi:MAG: MFS transporter, partial [Desulfitobacterium sp.]|nr:MFS transporter [Desulfitobacterium sp.]
TRPIAGRFLDRQGRRGVYFVGLAIFITCVFAYIWAPTVLLLLLIRFIHGFGWGSSSTASSTIATDIIPKPRLGEGMGYFGLTSTLAMAVAPALGLAIMSRLGFSQVFIISAISVIIAFLIATPIKFHKPTPGKEVPGKRSFFEKNAITPATIIFFVTMTYGAIVSFIALYAADKGIENIGLFFTVYALSLLISRPYFGKLSDRKGYAAAVLPGIIAVLVTMFLLYFANSLSAFLVAGFIYGIGFGATQPVLQAMAVRNVPPERRGSSNATFFVGFDLGIGVGSILWGIIAELVGFQTIYLLAMIPAVIGLFVFLKASKKYNESRVLN